MFDLDQAVAEWRRRMTADGVKNPALLDELESHLRDDLAEQAGSGIAGERAFDAAVGRLGQGRALQAEFVKTVRMKRARFRKCLWQASWVGLGLFVVGIIFCHYVMLPLAVSASEQYASWLGFKTVSWDAGRQLAFVLRFGFGLGCAFAMPSVLVFLVRTGLLNHQKMVNSRRYVVLVNLVLGGLLTTPEVLTQILMFIPLQLLFEASVWISGYLERRERRA